MRVDLYKFVSQLFNCLPYKVKKFLIKKIRPNLKRGAKIGFYRHVDFINDEGIGGWVIDVESSAPRFVEIYVNHEKIGM
jgi:hypothetical protein